MTTVDVITGGGSSFTARDLTGGETLAPYELGQVDTGSTNSQITTPADSNTEDGDRIIVTKTDLGSGNVNIVSNSDNALRGPSTLKNQDEALEYVYDKSSTVWTYVGGSTLQRFVDHGTDTISADVGTSSSPVSNVHSQSHTTDDINTVARLNGSSTETDLRGALSNASYGDRIVFEPGFLGTTITGGTLTVPAGVMLDGTAKSQGGGPYTLVKGFDGTLLEYNDWVTLRNIAVSGDSANHTGDNIAPQSASNRECLFESVTSEDAAGAAFVENETFLSTYVACDFASSQDGMSVQGTNHSPHNTFVRCRFQDNSRAGIDVQQFLDQEAYIGCLIDGNEIGVDTTRSAVGIPITETVSWIGTKIKNNDGPGVLLDGTNASQILLSMDAGCILDGNNAAVPAGITTPAGSIHSENGGRIRGTILARTNDIRRYNNDGNDAFDLVLGGRHGTVDLPSTLFTVLNSYNTGSLSGQSYVALDPSGALDNNTASSFSTSNVTTTTSLDADNTTQDEIADVLGTVINELQDVGVLN